MTFPMPPLPYVSGGVANAAPTRPVTQPRSGDSNRQASTPTGRTAAPRPAQPKKVNPGLAGVNASVAARIQAMIAAAPGRITLNSGFRSREQQQRLYDRYKAGKGPLAAKPGSSNHEHGLACDLGFQDEATRRWVHANAARFGLHFPVRGENWHVEPVESKGKALSPAAVQAGFKPINYKQIRSSGQGAAVGEQAKRAGTLANVGSTGGPMPGAAVGGGATPAVPGDVTVSSGIDVFGPDGPLDPEEAMARFGYIAEYAKSNPEIKKLLAEAIENDWSNELFTAKVQDTKWYKTTTETKRQMEVLKKTDPAEYRRKRQQMIDQFVIAARNLGVEEGKQRIFILAERALAEGWSDQEITRFIAADLKVRDTGNTGAVAVTVDTLKEQASQYGVPMSQQTLQMWTTQILRGMVPAESFESYLKEQAKSLFPGLAKAIDSGVTVAQYTAPYRELTAQILERNPAEITMDDPHIQKALYAVSKDGTRQQMTLSEYQQYLRGTDGFRKTRQAQETAAGFATRVTELFGKTA